MKLRPIHVAVRLSRTLYFVISAAALASFREADGANPYHTICERNVFHLRPLMVQRVESRRLPPSPPPVVRLTGLTDICGRDQALLEIAVPGRPLEKPILVEGDTVDGVEVLEIDVAQERAHVRIRGVDATLALESGVNEVAKPRSISPTLNAHPVKVFAGRTR